MLNSAKRYVKKKDNIEYIHWKSARTHRMTFIREYIWQGRFHRRKEEMEFYYVNDVEKYAKAY